MSYIGAFSFGKESVYSVFISYTFYTGNRFSKKILKTWVSIQSHKIPQGWIFAEAV